MNDKHLSPNPYHFNPNNSPKRIFITGGAGFIGANLVKYFLDKYSYEITVYDNLSAGSKKNLDCAISDSKKKATVGLIEGDVLDKERLEKETKNHTAIIHLAAHTNVIDSLKDPVDDFNVNAMGTFGVLEAARKNNIKSFIYASSNAVVGEQDPPINEEKIPSPISPYGASKLTGEALCSAYYHSYGIKTISLRFANCYGPYSYHKTSVVAKFVRQIKNGEKLTIYGDGYQTRDFIHVYDVCSAIHLALESNIGGEVFQIATETETTVNELVELMPSLANENREIVHTSERKGEIRKNYSSITKAKELLGFEPKIILKDGLNQLWNRHQ